MLIKYNIIGLKYIFFISIFVILSLPANSELSVEEIIKGRKDKTAFMKDLFKLEQ